jgi:hypothetical protein
MRLIGKSTEGVSCMEDHFHPSAWSEWPELDTVLAQAAECSLTVPAQSLDEAFYRIRLDASHSSVLKKLFDAVFSGNMTGFAR